MGARIVIKLAIVGSRSFDDYDHLVKSILENFPDLSAIKLIVSGGAKGADKLAERFASEHKIPIQIIKPDWSLGRHAAMLRNKSIVDCVDTVIAFWDNVSNGTEDTIKYTKKVKKKLYMINIRDDLITL